MEQSQSSISAFDNILITNNIAQYLSFKDTTACLKVSKAWYTHFYAYQWRTIAHFYTYQAENHDPAAHPRRQWWKPNNKKDDDDDKRKKKPSIHSNARSHFIFSTQRDLICSNAFGVRSLKIDYSAAILLDVPFVNLTRLTMNCRHSHNIDPTVKAAKRRRAADRTFQERVLALISLNPRLRELEVSYAYCWRPPTEGPPFSIRILQALQHRPSSTATAAAAVTTTTTTTTGMTATATTVSFSQLYSLRLAIQGCQSYGDICSIIENCPPSLQELAVQSSFYANSNSSPMFARSKNLEQRLASLKDNAANCTATTTTNGNNYSPRRQTPSFRLLSVNWYSARDGQELDVVDSDKFLYPLLACFPRLQDLTVPKIPCRDLKWGSALVSILTLSCPALTNINFGENLISEEHMFRFITGMPQGQGQGQGLQGLTMRITPLYANRVLPALLQQCGPTLQVLRLGEFGFANLRSTYIADILACCPRLKVFVVSSAPGKLRPFSKIALQDLLSTEWVCSELETLSISINELAAVTAQDTGTLYDGLASLALEDTENEKGNQLGSTAALTYQDYVHFSSMVRNVLEFYRRLNALPKLVTLSLQWSQVCQTVPYECGMGFSDNLLDVDKLQWMGLEWSARSGV
ncbi:hypothetical protein BGX30_013349 [Mortierella sp. GBA39]|nr:hypothetical protein BGX30_013349 [Mortierella sp. GBA39]